jgi:hypothetical protein
MMSREPWTGEAARWTATVLPDTAGGALRGLRCGGTLEAPHRSTATHAIDYELEEDSAKSTSG